MPLTADLLETMEQEAELAPPSMLERCINLVKSEARRSSPELQAHAEVLVLKLEHRLQCQQVERARSVRGEMLAPWLTLSESQSQAA